MIMVPLANPYAYFDRYSQKDKASSGLSRADEIDKAAYEYTKDIDSKRKIVVGVNDLKLLLCLVRVGKGPIRGGKFSLLRRERQRLS